MYKSFVFGFSLLLLSSPVQLIGMGMEGFPARYVPPSVLGMGRSSEALPIGRSPASRRYIKGKERTFLSNIGDLKAGQAWGVLALLKRNATDLFDYAESTQSTVVLDAIIRYLEQGGSWDDVPENMQPRVREYVVETNAQIDLAKVLSLSSSTESGDIAELKQEVQEEPIPAEETDSSETHFSDNDSVLSEDVRPQKTRSRLYRLLCCGGRVS